MSEANVIRDAGAIAEEINGIKARVRDTAVRGAIEIGKRLKEAKSLIPYGSWGKWLEDNVDYSERTAQNLMRIADEYGRKETQALAEIQDTTQAVLLLALNGEEREAFVKEHDMSEISTRQLQEEIRKLQEERERMQLTIDELMSAEGIEEGTGSFHEDDPDEEEKQTAEMEESRRRADELEKALEEANERLRQEEKRREKEVRAEREAKEKAVSDREAGKKREEEQERRIRRMEDELRAASEQVREVLPEQVEAELNRLRAQAARTGAESEMRAAFEAYKAAFERLMETLREAEEADFETAGKFRGAFQKATLTMAERMKA